MAWLFQGVLNAGLQILLSIAGGWLCAKLRLVDPEILSRQLNAFAMRAAFPAFIIHLLGIKTDLQDIRAWRALAVFILWVFVIHLLCLLWHHLRRKNSSVQHLGINCLLLTTNNTGCIGWPVLIATVGRQGAALSMLLGVLFFVQLLPVAITCFEYHKYLTSHGTDGAAATSQLTQRGASGKLPTTVSPPGREEAAPTGFPHEFRYCYWSNADYIPQKAARGDVSNNNDSTSIGSSSSKPVTGQAYPNYLEVHVGTSSDAPEEYEHHCYGGGRSASSSNGRNSNGSSSGTPTSSSSSASKNNSGKEWWRSGPPKQQQQQQQVQQGIPGLKRAKDSCDSLYTPFAAAASKEMDMNQRPQVVQSPKMKPGLTTLTRRLSGAVAAAAAAPASLARAASLKHAASAKRARDGKCDLSVPLMAGREGPTSCQGAGSAAGSSSGGSAAAGARTSHDGSSRAAGVVSAASKAATDKAGQEAATASSSSSTAGAFSARRSRSLGGAPAGPAANAAADSCLELHTMCAEPLKEEESEGHHDQHLAQQNSSIVSSNSFLSGRPDSIRINSRTGLLTALTTSSGFHKGAAAAAGRSKLGSVAGAVGAAGATDAGAAGGLPGQAAVQDVPRGGFKTFIQNHPLLVHITAVQLRSFHLWLNLVAIALSVSGARQYLDPDSPAALPALGWVDGVLSWFSAACIPVLLFANGVWMVGKDVFGGRKGQMQVTLILFLKLSLFPALMVGLTKLFGLNDAYGLSLVLLTSCPLAPLAFLVCQQYNVGAELATSVTIQGVLLMLPQMMALIKISQVTGLYDVDILKGA